MKSPHAPLPKLLYPLLLAALVALPSAASADTLLSVELPRLNVAEYHRPYLAAWVMEQQTGEVTNLAVWYQLDEEGKEWLKDLRQWWRRSGRKLDMPVDAFTGATKPPGVYDIELDGQLAGLPDGQYTLHVEASREVGGRELLKIDFAWPAAEPLNLSAEGEEELGTVTLSLAP
ncbi:DUF2271 domain-containing protein [Marinihelvus fidelis]|uniref:DUF2271 domain-containing protein n=1 Tax=Marinihelvus fidelis TaxID=2613842 RepID=A0A5N0TJL1_9GAMM|nr:DUF2271 domain-containing protein [Marinihelvus fidelis]KAA9134096.1 DUF2271 domain-containing protein [Marinihelvus fidelis]